MIGSILISGGSKGLGLAMVKHCLERGEKVAAFSRKMTPEVLELRNRHGQRFLFEELNAQNSTSVGEFVEHVSRCLGSIRGLVNNAAMGQDSLLAGIDAFALHLVILTNLTAPVALTRLVVKHMLAEGIRGRVVNISSICASKGYSGLSVYTATKAGLEGFTRSLAVELGPKGILVNAIAPGFFQSEMSRALAPEQVSAVERRTLTGKLITPEDVLPVLDLLLFGESSITGQVFHIDGGANV